MTGRFDLDHLRAEVAEQLSAEWPGEQRPELDDPQSLKRARLVCSGIRHRLDRSMGLGTGRLL
jgi:hypothetical protein